MIETDDRNKKMLLIKWMRRAFRFGVPLVILYLIITKIDYSILKSSFIGTNLYAFLLGLLFAPVLILIGAIRWRVMLQQYLKKKVALAFALNKYWIGWAIGYFTPASLGLDTYRIVVAGKYFGDYPKNILIIFIEKFVALITCLIIIVTLYPLVPVTADHRIKQIVFAAYILLLSSIIVALLVMFLMKNEIIVLLFERMMHFISFTLRSIRMKMGTELMTENVKITLRMITQPGYLHHFIIVIALTLGIQLVSSIKSQIFFIALGYDLPFIINLFVAPTIYFIFLLPISLGSIGIREGVYILLYGLFGVPVEVALLVSFYNLMGILLNNAIGGVVIFFSRWEPDDRNSAHEWQDLDTNTGDR